MAEVTLRTFADTVHTSVASSATSVALIAANTRRKAIIFQNTSTAILYIYLNGAAGAATATTAHSLQLASNASYAIEGFTGSASGIWAAANGQVNITEFI